MDLDNVSDGGVLVGAGSVEGPVRSPPAVIAKPVSGRAKWSQMVLEGVVIVGSILLAFAIDAAWDARGERQLERSLLEALAEDFRIAEQGWATAKAAHNTVVSSMETLLTWAEQGSVPTEHHALADTLLGNVFWRNTFDPPMGTVEAILGSGRLDLLGNRELVGALTRWSSLVTDVNRREIDGADHFYEAVYPYLRTRLNIQDLDKVIPREVPWQHQPAEAYRLVSDQEFHNVIYVHWVLYWNVQLGMPEVDESISLISELLVDELGG
jgi:hypothetical protein